MMLLVVISMAKYIIWKITMSWIQTYRKNLAHLSNQYKKIITAPFLV